MIRVARPREFATAAFVLALSIGFLLWARTYPAPSSTMPILVAWGTIVLALIDVISQTDTLFGRWLRRLVTAEKIVEWKLEGDEDIPAIRVFLSVFWVFAYLAALLLVGFIVATSIYMLLYMIIHGRRNYLFSALATAATTLTIWLTFVVLFKYPLYPGLLFGGY